MRGKPKGTPRTPGSGRAKGTQNKNTTAVKDMLRGALDELGGQQYLIDAAKAEPRAFLTLIGKLIPNEVVAEIRGEIKLEVIDLSDKGNQ